jgi:hypothetical protein
VTARRGRPGWRGAGARGGRVPMGEPLFLSPRPPRRPSSPSSPSSPQGASTAPLCAWSTRPPPSLSPHRLDASLDFGPHLGGETVPRAGSVARGGAEVGSEGLSHQGTGGGGSGRHREKDAGAERVRWGRPSISLFVVSFWPTAGSPSVPTSPF